MRRLRCQRINPRLKCASYDIDVDRCYGLSKRNVALESIVAFAIKKGADKAKLIDAKEVIIDPRVRMKCEIPRCSNFDAHLLCPPNLMPIDEFQQVVRSYQKAVLVQKQADYDSADKSREHLTLGLCEEIESATKYTEFERRLHMLVNDVEAEAFKEGFYLAVGLIGGECLLCEECVGPGGGEPCRHPFLARPSMEAMGIDVVATCKKAGLSISLSSRKKVNWTGIVFLE